MTDYYMSLFLDKLIDNAKYLGTFSSLQYSYDGEVKTYRGHGRKIGPDPGQQNVLNQK